jgi:hypothetical protein
MGERPEVPAVAQPIVMIVGCYLLWRWLERPYRGKDSAMGVHARTVPRAVIIVLTVSYAASRVIGAYPGLLSDRSFTRIQTKAGSIKLSTGASAVIYEYVMAHTGASESVLELPMTGGMSFAMKRSNPVYNSLFWEIRPEPGIQRLDLEAIKRHPPGVVVALKEPAFGTYYGYPYRIACPCPRLVWQADALAGDPNVTLLIAEYVKENYEVESEVLPWVFLRRRHALEPLRNPADASGTRIAR